MVLDWYPTTTFTTPDDCDRDSSEQPGVSAATTISTDASRTACRLMKRPGVKRFSAEEIGHVDGDGASRTAGGTRPAIPAFVDVHVGLAGVGIDGQCVERADLDTQRAAVDTQRFVNGYRHVGAVVVDQRHGLLLIK